MYIYIVIFYFDDKVCNSIDNCKLLFNSLLCPIYVLFYLQIGVKYNFDDNNYQLIISTRILS
jgi:hypothetical protein